MSVKNLSDVLFDYLLGISYPDEDVAGKLSAVSVREKEDMPADVKGKYENPVS